MSNPASTRRVRAKYLSPFRWSEPELVARRGSGPCKYRYFVEADGEAMPHSEITFATVKSLRDRQPRRLFHHRGKRVRMRLLRQVLMQQCSSSR